MNIEIDDARSGDLERLTEMYSCYDLHRNRVQAENYVKAYLNHWRIKVARVDDIIQGACFWRPEGEKVWGLAWIEDLWVEKNFREKSLGGRLLKSAIEDAKKWYESDGIKLRKIALTAQESNPAARGLYEKVGFVKTSALGDLYMDGIEDSLYVLDLR